MKRSATEVIRRGFESTVANWPLLLIRVAESILLVILAVVAVFAAIIPVIISLGIGASTIASPEDLAELITGLLVDQWMIILYVLAIVTLVVIFFVAIHSFVEAGSARVYVDAERAASAVAVPRRQQFRVFTAERWFAGAKGDWWSVFWIYNIAWGVAGLIMLAPLIVVGALMIILRDSPGMLVGVSCLGLLFSLLFLFVVAVVTNVWCQKAIVVCVAGTHSAPGALGSAWREFRADAGRHIAVAVILFLIIVVGSGLFASISFVGGMNDSAAFAVAMLPIQLIGSLANSAFSAAMAAWFLASFAALSVEN